MTPVPAKPVPNVDSFPDENMVTALDGGLVFIQEKPGVLNVAWFNDRGLPGEKPSVHYVNGASEFKELSPDVVHQFTVEPGGFTILVTVGAGKPVIGWGWK